MLTLLTTAALANPTTPAAPDAVPFQRSAPSAVELGAGHGTVELGTAIVDGLVTESDFVYSDLGAVYAFSDRFAMFGHARLHQSLASSSVAGLESPRMGMVGARVLAVRTKAFRLAPWGAVDAGNDLADATDDVGVQLGLAANVAVRKWSLDVSLPLARLRFTEDPVSLEDSLLHSALNSSLSTTIAFDEHHAVRGGLESGLPYVSYRFQTNGWSVEPSVGVPFVGVRAGAAF